MTGLNLQKWSLTKLPFQYIIINDTVGTGNKTQQSSGTTKVWKSIINSPWVDWSRTSELWQSDQIGFNGLHGVPFLSCGLTKIDVFTGCRLVCGPEFLFIFYMSSLKLFWKETKNGFKTEWKKNVCLQKSIGNNMKVMIADEWKFEIWQLSVIKKKKWILFK